MDYLTNKRFSFSSDALSPDTFGVVKFAGSEGISRCYSFEVTLVSDDLELNLPDIVQNPARLTLHRDDGDVSYHGILLSFEQLSEFNRLAFYRAHLVPRLEWLSFTQHNQVFLNQSVPEIVEACLKDGGLMGSDFEFRLKGSYDPLEYVCQYGESHLNFISRWCEREGIYYFFEQSDAGEKVIFTDTQISHTPYSQGDIITYSPPSGLEAGHEKEIVSSFACRMSLTPRSVLLKDYNYRKPSLDISGSADVDPMGRGQVYSYGDHIRTPEEGGRLAKIRAEAILCGKEVFHGEGSVPYMMPGYTFTLKDHYRGSFNQSYLVTDITHEGNQTGYLIAGITTGEEDRRVFYRNNFSSIVSTVQFRPGQTSIKPRISGTLTAKIDAAGSGEYAELDTQGRYTAILPFDLSGKKDGKASAPIRMAQPYAGSNHGMHFPLHKGTEVLLTFIDGDPDRPIIQSAVPNPETSSPVNVNNQTMSAITTSSGNKIHIEDKAGSERILSHSPNQNTYLRIGAPNDPSVAADGDGGSDNIWWQSGCAAKSGGLLDIEAQFKCSIVLGESTSTVIGGRVWFTGVAQWDMVLGGRINISIPHHLHTSNGEVEMHVDDLRQSVETTVNTAIDTELHAAETRMINRLRTHTAAVVGAAGRRTRAAQAKYDQAVQRINAADQDAQAYGGRLDTRANDINLARQRLNSIATDLKVFAAQLETNGNTTDALATAVDNSAVRAGRIGTAYTEAGGLLIRN